MPRAMPVTSSALESSNSGPSSFSICVFSQRSSRVCTFSRGGAGQPLVGDDAQPRMQRIVGRDQLGHGIAGPADGAVGGQHELLVGGRAEFLGARVDLARQHLLRGGLQRLGVGARFRRVGRKGKAVEPADRMALDDHFAHLADFGTQN